MFLCSFAYFASSLLAFLPPQPRQLARSRRHQLHRPDNARRSDWCLLRRGLPLFWWLRCLLLRFLSFSGLRHLHCLHISFSLLSSPHLVLLLVQPFAVFLFGRCLPMRPVRSHVLHLLFRAVASIIGLVTRTTTATTLCNPTLAKVQAIH